MKIFQLLLVVLICTTLFCSCESLIEKLFGKNEELSFTKTEYNGDQLRIDGYYYCKHEGAELSRLRILFFYRDGILLYGGFPLLNELGDRENEFISGQYSKFAKKYPSDWGLFTVDSISIQYEMLYGGPFLAYIDSGIIINDTTFVILKRKSSYGKDEKVLQDTFRLKPFSPKPDSTNIYIK